MRAGVEDAHLLEGAFSAEDLSIHSLSIAFPTRTRE